MLDLKADEGREVFLRLCEGADVLVETFSPGTMDRLGLSYADVSPRFPRLVFCSVPGYPPGHRFADRPGWDATVQARSGMQSEQPGWRPGPIYLHFPAPSMAACFLLATGVLSALIRREATGRGQHVQTSLYQGVLGVHHADLAGARASARRLSLDDGEDVSARHPSDHRSSSVPAVSGSTPRR